MKIGYLGVGTIASCMIEGFCGLDSRHEFFLSPRNAEKSAALKAKYGNVKVCESNQHVVDEADLVFISMLAKDCLEVLGGLRFRKGQKIINLVATIPPEDIFEAVGGQVESCSHIVPLPYIKARIGPIAAYPESRELSELLSPLGTVVFARSIDEVRVMQSITALMSTFFEMLHHLAVFAEGEGLGRKKAADFMSAFFGSLSQRAKGSENLHDLALDMTPGGLNEFALNTLTESGAIKAWADVLIPVMGRIKK